MQSSRPDSGVLYLDVMVITTVGERISLYSRGGAGGEASSRDDACDSHGQTELLRYLELGTELFEQETKRES
jgi:hypothetical protein